MRRLAAILLLGLVACDELTPSHPAHAAAPLRPTETSADLTVDDATQSAFSLPLPVLDAAHRATFFVGNSLFNQSWVSAPSSVTARDGLGPLFNARSCSGCHFKDGRGRPPAAGEPMTTAILRLSTGIAADGSPLPDPVYGEQLQGRAVAGAAPEGDVYVDYREQTGTFPDGEPYSLRIPTVRIEALGHGPLAAGLQTSARVAPPLIGLGLLEAVPAASLLARDDPDDRDHDGISGRAAWIPATSTGARTLGRFGWKAEQPTVRAQTAAAFVSDLGITSGLFPSENHSERQRASLPEEHGGMPEATDAVLDAVVLYARTLAVPAARALPDDLRARGEASFARAECGRCHVPTLTTGADAILPELASRTFHAYTDLLLHDLGPQLADERPVYAASGREWRTAPLWGLGLVERVNGHTFFLHDGRARNLSEAILFHDGEAARSREAFLHMSRAEREALLAFVGSL